MKDRQSTVTDIMRVASAALVEWSAVVHSLRVQVCEVCRVTVVVHELVQLMGESSAHVIREVSGGRGRRRRRCFFHGLHGSIGLYCLYLTVTASRH